MRPPVLAAARLPERRKFSHVYVAAIFAYRTSSRHIRYGALAQMAG
jgi:hypothetical protein